jgi:hypothetical protein
MPLGPADRDSGYWWEASMRQVEVSRTIVFDAPRRARSFFEALTGDNLDIGRPASVEIIFGRQIRRNTPVTFRTAIDRPAIGPDAGGVVLNIFYKHSWVRQSAPARKPSSRALPLSGSRTRPWTRTGGGPRRCAWEGRVKT